MASSFFTQSYYDQLKSLTGKGTPNYSLYAVPIAFGLSILPHIIAILSSGGRFTNVCPRQYVASLQKKENKSTHDEFVLRAESAQQNSFEQLGWFAAAVVAANVAKLPAHELNTLAFGYLASRLAYIFSFLLISNEALSYIRSAIFFVGVAIIITLYTHAATALA